MTSEIFGVISIELRIECFKGGISSELSDFTLIDKLIIIVIELYAVPFELFHILKADTVILLTAGQLIDLECTLCLFHIIIGADRVLCLEIVKDTLFLSGQFRVSFKERNENVKHSLRSFLIIRLIERVLRIAEDTLIIGADMVDQRTAARALAVANIKAAVIVELLTVDDSGDAEISLFIISCVQLRNHTLLMLFIIKVRKDRIAESETAIGVSLSKIGNDTAFTYPFIALILAEVERQAIRLLFGSFCFKAHMILFLCNDSKSPLSLIYISENLMECFLDTVQLRSVIALFPICHCSTVKRFQKVSYLFIGNIGDSIEHIITNPPECEVIELLMGTVNESLSDLLKGNKTLHTAETAMISVLSSLRMQGVAEVFSIIIGTVRHFTLFKNELNIRRIAAL